MVKHIDNTGSQKDWEPGKKSDPYPTKNLFPDCRVDSDREKEQDKLVAELRQRLETLEERFSKLYF